MNFTNSTPELDAMTNERAPRMKIMMVFQVRNSLAWVEQPTVRPSSITIASLRAEPAVLAKRVVLVLSFSRFPKSIPSSGSPDGTRNAVSSNPTMGKMMRSVCDTWRCGFMWMVRSFLVVSSRINGGWMSGTSAM